MAILPFFVFNILKLFMTFLAVGSCRTEADAEYLEETSERRCSCDDAARQSDTKAAINILAKRTNCHEAK